MGPEVQFDEQGHPMMMEAVAARALGAKPSESLRSAVARRLAWAEALGVGASEVYGRVPYGSEAGSGFRAREREREKLAAEREANRRPDVAVKRSQPKRGGSRRKRR